MKTYVISDIHGDSEKLISCLEQCRFNRSQDRLIVCGDICDRGSDTKGVIDILLTITNVVFILGNHDTWLLDWIDGEKDPFWEYSYGAPTIRSYDGQIPSKEHIDFLKKGIPYFLERKNCFVHGGFDLSKEVQEQTQEDMIWNRDLVKYAYIANGNDKNTNFFGFDNIFVGHTPTQHYGSDKPLNLCNVWMIDTGCGFGENLTIVDIKTKQYWQSEVLKNQFITEKMGGQCDYQ